MWAQYRDKLWSVFPCAKEMLHFLVSETLGSIAQLFRTKV